MAFDGGFLHNVCDQLQQAVGAHVDKIYQPARDVLVLTLRKKGFVKRLVLSAASGNARVHFTEQKYENPETPPMFCMLARKIFLAARLQAVTQKGLERVVEFTFSASNELGDRVDVKIICELLSGSGNIILVGEDNKIFDAVHRSDIEKSDRLIVSGATYRYPDSQNKINILTGDINSITDKILEQKVEILSTAMLKTLEGVSPLVCRELSYIYYGGDIAVADITDKAPLSAALNKLKNSILSGEYYMLYKADNTPADFCYMPILQYGDLYTYRCFDAASSLLDAFYFERENAARISKASSDITKLVSNLLSRARRRMAARQKELIENSNREDLRIKGELIKANLYAISAGSSVARVQNYYDENMGLEEISLDPSLTPQQNAAKYFKDYKKSLWRGDRFGRAYPKG